MLTDQQALAAVARRLLARPIDPSASDVRQLASWVLHSHTDGPSVPATDETSQVRGHLCLLPADGGGARWAFHDGRYTWTDQWGRRRRSAFGTRLLRSGDQLTVYPAELDEVSSGNVQPLWRGVVALEAGPTTHDETVPGDEIGIGAIAWRGWFLQELPAELQLG